MKHVKDNQTLELPMPGAKRGRGRPPTFSAMTNAERQKAYRDRQREIGTPRAPRSKHEAELQMDYTRPTWEQHDEQLAAVHSQVRHLHGQLEAAKAVIAGLQNDLNHAKLDTRDMNKLDAALKEAKAEIVALRQDQSLMIAERAAAFQAADQAKAELQRVTHMSVNSGKLACQVLELEADKAQLEMEKGILAQQGAALVNKVRELEEKIKRNASRKKKPAEPTDKTTDQGGM
jgi:chromosome segregation ATPase